MLDLDPVSAAGISFLAGLLAPLGAVCVLPLYPGYLAWLANQVGEGDDRTLLFRFSLVVTAGIIFAFFVIGFVVTWLLRSSVSAAIGIISMVAFVILAGASICLIAGIDLSLIIPSPKMLHPVGPYKNALLFGLFFGLIMLPCNPLCVKRECGRFFGKYPDSYRFLYRYHHSGLVDIPYPCCNKLPAGAFSYIPPEVD